jgi:hypothetical protein
MMHPKFVVVKIKAYIDMIYAFVYTSQCLLSGVNLLHQHQNWFRRLQIVYLLTWMQLPLLPRDKMGLGVVVRDHTGAFLAACAEHFDEVICPKIAEALALRRAISFAIDEGYSKVILASDCHR